MCKHLEWGIASLSFFIFMKWKNTGAPKNHFVQISNLYSASNIRILLGYY